MEYYFIFLDKDCDDEPLAVLAETYDEAVEILTEEGFTNIEIDDQFAADEYGDDLIDSYGLDVF